MLKFWPWLKKDSLVIAAGLLIILALIILSFKKFSDQGVDYTYQMNLKRLQELSAQNIDTIYIELKNAQDQVRSAAAAFAALGDLNSAHAAELLGQFLDHSEFNRMWLVDPQGRAFDRRRRQVNLPEQVLSFAQNSPSGITKIKKSVLTQAEVFQVFAPIIRDHEYQGAVIGIYEIHSLILRTENPQFGGTGYTHVFEAQGQLILKAENPNSLLGGDNLWDFLATVTFENGSSLEQIYNDVQKGRPGAIVYRLGNQVRMGHYAPIGLNGWYMMSVATDALAENYSESINLFAFELLLKVFACFLFLMLGLIYFAGRTQRRILAINNLLQISNRRFQVAALQLSRQVIEYDNLSHQIYKIGVDYWRDQSQLVANWGSDLISGRLLDEKSLDLLKAALSRLTQGRESDSCVVEVKDESGGRHWHQLVFTNVFDDDGRPIRAVGTIEDITNQKEAEIRFTQEERHRQVVMAEILTTFVFNVSQDRYLYGYVYNVYQELVEGSFYERRLRPRVWAQVHPEDRQKIMDLLAPDKLKKDFQAGRGKVELDFRGLETGGPWKWYNCTVNLAVDPDSRDLIGYGYIRDIHQSKLDELALKNEAEHDGLTGLLNRGAVDRLLGKHLRKAKAPNRVEAFLIIDLDHFKDINDTYGHSAGDEALKLMAGQLTGLFRRSDIVGRMGGDEFVVFLGDAHSVELVETKARAICEALKDIRLSFDDRLRLTGSVGVYVLPPEGADLTAIYAKADLALYEAKKAGRDGYAVFSPALVPPEAP